MRSRSTRSVITSYSIHYTKLYDELQETERALQEALAANPDNRFLNQRMLELRARQLGFLKQLAALEQTTWRLTI